MAYPKQMAYNDPYNNFQARPTDGSAYSAYLPNSTPSYQLTSVSSELPQTEKTRDTPQELDHSCCWKTLEPWQKVLIVGLPLLLVLGLGIGVGSQFNFQYSSSICISDDDTSCAGPYITYLV
jgi:hypothetical protein